LNPPTPALPGKPTNPAPETHGSLRNAAASGTKWVAFSQASRVTAQLLGMLILARLLSPSDFGVVAMAAVVTGFAGIFRDLGTVAAVIQKPQLSEALLDSVFWLNVGIGACIAVLLAMLAPALAVAMRETRLVEVLWTLAVVFPIASLGLVHQALFERASRFRSVAMIECCAAFVGLAAGVAAALAGWGVYALVSQTVAASLVATAGLWATSPWRPGWHFSLMQIRQLARFSGNLVGVNTFTYFARNADTLLIGRFLGTTELGYYNVAYRLMLWPLQNISWVAGRALFPALSRIQDDKERLRRGYTRAVAAVFLVTAPLTLGLFVLREPFVAAVLGESWSTVSDLLFWLAPVSVVQSVGTTVGWLYRATGRTDVMFKVAAVSGSIAICAFVIGLQWGVEGVAAAYCTASLIVFWPSLAIALRLVGLSLPGFLRQLGPTFLAACLMASLLALGSAASAPLELPLWPRLLLLAAFGALAYLVVSMIIQRPMLRDMTNALLSR